MHICERWAKRRQFWSRHTRSKQTRSCSLQLYCEEKWQAYDVTNLKYLVGEQCMTRDQESHRQRGHWPGPWHFGRKSRMSQWIAAVSQAMQCGSSVSNNCSMLNVEHDPGKMIYDLLPSHFANASRSLVFLREIQCIHGNVRGCAGPSVVHVVRQIIKVEL